jgi:hypothetical protein
VDEFEEFLQAHGYLCREQPISREEARLHVLESAEGDPERVRTIFERLWDSLESSGSPGSRGLQA